MLKYILNDICANVRTAAKNHCYIKVAKGSWLADATLAYYGPSGVRKHLKCDH